MLFILAIDLKSLDTYADQPKGIKADTTLTISDDDFVDISLKKLNPQVAFMKGKLKVVGNPMVLQKLDQIIRTESKL